MSGSSAQNYGFLVDYSQSDTVIYIQEAQEEICVFFQAEMRLLLCDTLMDRHDAVLTGLDRPSS